MKSQNEPQIIVLGNIYDETNQTQASGRVYGGGGIAPTVGACHFQQEKWIIEVTRIEDINSNDIRKG